MSTFAFKLSLSLTQVEEVQGIRAFLEALACQVVRQGSQEGGNREVGDQACQVDHQMASVDAQA